MAKQAGQCRVLTASYGGSKTLLIQADVNGETLFTALTVVEGFERSMMENYVNSRAPGGRSIGEVVRLGGTNEARRNDRLRQHPCHRQLRHRNPTRHRQCVERIDHSRIAIEVERLRHGVLCRSIGLFAPRAREATLPER